jgi:hypothetical protein
MKSYILVVVVICSVAFVGRLFGIDATLLGVDRLGPYGRYVAAVFNAVLAGWGIYLLFCRT